MAQLAFHTLIYCYRTNKKHKCRAHAENKASQLDESILTMKLKIKVGKGKRSSAPTAVGGCDEAAPQQTAPLPSQPQRRTTLFQVHIFLAVSLWAAGANFVLQSA